jgi:hypothetical protein
MSPTLRLSADGIARGSYRDKTGHASPCPARLNLTQSGASPPSIDALQNDQSLRHASDIRLTADYGIVASGGEPCGTPHALYSKPFAFRTVWAAGEERNVTSAVPASV